MTATGKTELPSLERVYDFQKWEATEIGVVGIDSPDAVFFHQNGSAGVKNQVAGDERKLLEDFGGDLLVAFCFLEYAQTGRGQYGLDESPRMVHGPRLPKDVGMRGHAKKLIHNAPGKMPSRRLDSPRQQQIAAPLVLGRMAICRVDKHVCVGDEHSQRSMTSYKAFRSAMSTLASPKSCTGSGDSLGAGFRFCSRVRRAASTSSDIVRPCRAASRLSRFIVTSLMFRVVFIW